MLELTIGRPKNKDKWWDLRISSNPLNDACGHERTKNEEQLDNGSKTGGKAALGLLHERIQYTADTL